MNEIKSVSQVVDLLIKENAKSAVKYLSEKLVVRASRRLFRGKILKDNVEIILKIGRPNYLEREFIKECKKAKEPFPVKKIQLKFPPVKRKK